LPFSLRGKWFNALLLSPQVSNRQRSSGAIGFQQLLERLQPETLLEPIAEHCKLPWIVGL
jgi:hypothetical protein